jgi:hypothetical protein
MLIFNDFSRHLKDLMHDLRLFSLHRFLNCIFRKFSWIEFQYWISSSCALFRPFELSFDFEFSPRNVFLRWLNIFSSVGWFYLLYSLNHCILHRIAITVAMLASVIAIVVIATATGWISISLLLISLKSWKKKKETNTGTSLTRSYFCGYIH